MLGEYVKGAKEFPLEGQGPGETQGDLAVRAIKLMTRWTIELSVIDEVAAVTGERPLEQIADSSGYAVGGVAVQMREDLKGFHALCTHSKGLTASVGALELRDLRSTGGSQSFERDAGIIAVHNVDRSQQPHKAADL